MRRHALCTAAPACLLLGLSPLAAYADTTPTPTPGTPAPAATASATAARISNLLTISDTAARADATKGDRPGRGDLARRPADPRHRPQPEQRGREPRRRCSTPERCPSTSRWPRGGRPSPDRARPPTATPGAKPPLARLEIPSLIKASVLGSQADADHTSDKSTATSTSDAADVNVADVIRLVLLHSEVTSVGKGHSFLIGLNGNEIGTDDQLGKSPLCALDASVASLSCLTAAGGVGNNGTTAGAAQVAGVTSAIGVVSPVDAFATAASFGTGTPAPAILPAVGAPVLPAEAARAATLTPAATAPAASSLPRTGVALASTLASGFAALLSGLGLSLFGRRRRRAA